jgi:UDP-glucose 4-epimerase
MFNRIAVTGGAGLIGRRLVKRLQGDGYYVRSIDLYPPEGVTSVDVCLADITDQNQVISALDGCETVYHFAGSTLHMTRRDPASSVLLNVKGTLNVLEACRVLGLSRILFASTVSVYDRLEPWLTADEDTPLPFLDLEPFGASKLFAESLIRYYAQRYGFNYVIFRIGSVYGPGNCTNVVRTFIESAQQEARIICWGQGSRGNQYTFVEDIVDGCSSALMVDNETYNLTSPELITIKELAELVQKKCGGQIEFDQTKTEELTRCFVSCQKAVGQLNWNWTPINLGLEQTLSEMNYSAKK